MVGQFVAHWFDVRDWFGLLGSYNEVVETVKVVPPIPPTPTMMPAPTSTPIPQLTRMLNSAKAIPYEAKRVLGLRSVAEAAIKNGNYEIAIEAAVFTPRGYYLEQAKTLTFVARCAYGEGLFKIAYSAARKITHDSHRSDVINEILNVEKMWPHEINPPDGDLASVTCLR